ncbi:MAG: alpha/beta fold hydrolase [SAR324 cluster bacterium]|nr:alpha/beta fold hydrolase [SAR324 cluster bacterium]
MCETHFIPVEGEERIAVDWTVPATPEGSRAAVFVHGFASHRQGEKATFFAERFQASGWHFLSLDMRGHGDSSSGMEALTLSRCIADLHAALDWIPKEIAPPLLIASSMGGAVAAWYYLLHPGRAGALACIAPSFSFPSHLRSELSQQELQAWQERGLRRVQNEWLDVQVGYGLMEDAQNYDPRRLVKEYSAPTLIFHGILDDAVDWRESINFMEDCPATGIDLLLIKEGDHRLTEYKEYMFESIMSWLRRLEPAQ